ncbi:HD domain-containing protein [Candidatus Curtissbacteria bacterium]|nr:HD domain-containing protein [Candidatus Curtissbacteria bacterium]
MSKSLKDFHHYKGTDLSPTEKVERKVAELLLTTNIADSERESSIVWELKHSSGCCQIGRILAQKRGIDADIAGTICVLHDIYVIISGSYQDHAKNGAPIAEKILKEVGGFSAEEIEIITGAIAHHSEKEINSNEPYAELVKDADVFDCSMYAGAEGFYRLHKSEDIFKQYEKRVRKVRKELNLPEEPVSQMPLFYYFGARWPRTVLIYKGRDVIWSNNWKDLYQLGAEMVDFYKSAGEKKKFWNDAKKVKDGLKREFLRLDKVDLGNLDNEHLLASYEQFCEIYIRFWQLGWFDEPIAFECERILTESSLSKEELSKLMAPSWVPFVTEIQKDLLLILKTYKQNSRRGELLVAKHCEKYFWKRNSYLQSFLISKEEVEEEVVELSRNIANPGKEINRLEKQRVDNSKQKYMAKLPKDLRSIVGIMDEFGKHQDERKSQMMMAAFYIDRFLEEIGKRVGISLEQMRYTMHGEIKDLVVDKNKLKDHIKRRMKRCVIIWDGETYTIGLDKSVDETEKELFGKPGSSKVIQVVGMTASAGTVVGKVVILKSPKDANKVKIGDILIAPMTSPDYVVAMKKAGAIVTDWGGMTSHAAIVAREFAIPCVVGTDVATKVFRDGDTVQVLADEGIVRKI